MDRGRFWAQSRGCGDERRDGFAASDGGLSARWLHFGAMNAPDPHMTTAAASTPTQDDPLAWARRHAGLLAALLWTGVYLLNAVANTATVGIEHAREGRDTPTWQIASWEWSSAAMLLALVPFVLWAGRRFPLEWGSLRRHLLIHVGLSVVYSLIHVLGMVLIRELVYAAHGLDYRFGPWPRELLYEYLKDWRSYLIVLLIGHFGRLWLLRSQGEARLLDAPDDAPAESSAEVERPERFLVKKLGREFLVPAREIEYAMAAGNYVNLHVRGHVYPLRSTITSLEERLDPAAFQRVHRSVIVQLDQIVSIEPVDSGEARLRLKCGAELPCSRRYRAALRERAEA
jgi:hypothetical protein